MTLIEDLTAHIRAHRCYRHPIFMHWAEVRPDPRAVGALFHHIQTLCACTRPGCAFTDGLAALEYAEGTDILRRIVQSEEDHGPQLATMAGFIVNRAAREPVFSDLSDQVAIEDGLRSSSRHLFGALPGYDRGAATLVQDRAVRTVFELREKADPESTYRNVGSLLAIEMLANNHIIPGEQSCLIDSGYYGDIADAPEMHYLREHGGEAGAESWHEQEAIRAVAGVLRHDTEALIRQGADACLDTIVGLWDLLDVTLLHHDRRAAA